MNRARATILALALALLAPQGASAAPVTFDLESTSDSTLGALVRMTYTALSEFQATLTLDITNTSDSWDPRLTSFAFNTPAGILAVNSFISETAGWSYTFDRNRVDTPGTYGYFDVAGLTGPRFNGGSPNRGIARDEERTFTFGLSGVGLHLFSEATFYTSLSYDPPRGPNESEQYFIARFQQTGPDGEDSDVAIAVGTPRSVPEPTTLTLLGLGAVGLFARRRTQLGAR